jgi:nitrile hydratase
MTKEGDHNHHHGKEHGHHHEPPNELEVRVKAIEALMAEKGLIDPEGIASIIDAYENKIGPQIGARLVARAWLDPKYKELALSDGKAAADQLDASALQGDLLIVENTPDLHNVVVCTLCSCYPWSVLGLPPTWYKSMQYRSRVVREPRAVIKEFGYEVPTKKEVRVWDSNSELRYMVLPERPAGTEGMSEDELMKLVTRDSMIGVVDVKAPA